MTLWFAFALMTAAAIFAVLWPLGRRSAAPGGSDMAVYRATYNFTSTDPKTKAPATETGNWVIGYKTVDGGWKMAWSVVSDTPAAAPKAAAPPAK